MTQHRRPEIRFTDAPRGTCRWCGDPIHYESGPKHGELDRRRRWHPACVDEYNQSDPRELRARIRKRDRGICNACGLDTNALRRTFRGRGRTKRLRAAGFLPRRSLWELDHTVPLIDGGTHDPSNLQTLCVPCHRAKSAAEARERAAPASNLPPPDEKQSAVQRRFVDKAEASEDEWTQLMARVDRANSNARAVLGGEGAIGD